MKERVIFPILIFGTFVFQTNADLPHVELKYCPTGFSVRNAVIQPSTTAHCLCELTKTVTKDDQAVWLHSNETMNMTIDGPGTWLSFDQEERDPNPTYTCQAQSTLGNGNSVTFSPVYKSLSREDGDFPSSDEGLTLILGVCGALVFIIIIVLVICAVWRKKKVKKGRTTFGQQAVSMSQAKKSEPEELVSKEIPRFSQASTKPGSSIEEHESLMRGQGQAQAQSDKTPQDNYEEGGENIYSVPDHNQTAEVDLCEVPIDPHNYPRDGMKVDADYLDTGNFPRHGTTYFNPTSKPTI